MLINSKVNIFFLLIYLIYIFCFFYFDLFLNLPNLAFSRESISLVIVFVTINLIIAISFFLEDRVSIKKIAIMWLMLLIPFLRFSLKELEIDTQSDPSRYYTYALQIIEFKTFLANPLNPERYLIDQPFYRYYLIPFILIFGKLNYFFTFFNLTIYVLITAHFSNFLKYERKNFNISKIIIIYLFISSAYIAKNILSVQLEWLCVLLSMMIFFSYINKNTLLLFILLAILSLQRQNFLLVSFFIFFIYIFENLKDNKEGLILSSIIFILILLYPLLHNMIFASSEYKYRYFSLSVAHLFLQNPGSEVETLSSRNY